MVIFTRISHRILKIIFLKYYNNTKRNRQPNTNTFTLSDWRASKWPTIFNNSECSGSVQKEPKHKREPQLETEDTDHQEPRTTDCNVIAFHISLVQSAMPVDTNVLSLVINSCCCQRRQSACLSVCWQV